MNELDRLKAECRALKGRVAELEAKNAELLRRLTDRDERVTKEFRAEDRRLVILRLLEQSPCYETNESLIATFLRQFGHAVSRDRIRTDLAWLKEQGLVTVEEFELVQIAAATQRGIETAQGIITTPGVKRAGPR